MQTIYKVKRFKAHFDEGGQCTRVKKVVAIDTKAWTLFDFKFKPRARQSMPAIKPVVLVSKSCPGLTRDLDPRIENYLNRTSSYGGGSKSLDHLSEEHYDGKVFAELSDSEKAIIRRDQVQHRTWRSDTSPGVMATFASGLKLCVQSFDVQDNPEHKNLHSVTPCDPCRLLLTIRAFQSALNKPTPEPSNLKFVQ